MMQQGTFPKAVNISERRVAWIESDIDQWISERIASHRASHCNDGGLNHEQSYSRPNHPKPP